jgi:hypothetical protein
MESEELNKAGSATIGRRRVLQGVAVGGALWAAPSVLTLDRASAAPGSAQGCPMLNCHDQTYAMCGVGSVTCFCTTAPGGGTVCFDGGGFCATCSSDADCVDAYGAGYQCGQLDDCSCGPGVHTFCANPADCLAPDARSKAVRRDKAPKLVAHK